MTGRKFGPTDDDVEALADAMCVLLNDMGENGKSVCGLAKAKARIAFEPFRLDDCGELMDLEAAERIVAECEGAALKTEL